MTLDQLVVDDGDAAQAEGTLRREALTWCLVSHDPAVFIGPGGRRERHERRVPLHAVGDLEAWRDRPVRATGTWRGDRLRLADDGLESAVLATQQEVDEATTRAALEARRAGPVSGPAAADPAGRWTEPRWSS